MAKKDADALGKMFGDKEKLKQDVGQVSGEGRAARTSSPGSLAACLPRSSIR